jgi:hypothetical protein
MCKIEIDINDVTKIYENKIIPGFRGGKIPLKGDSVDAMRYSFNVDPIHLPVNKKLPEKYIINKGATILFWKDGTKTVVRRAKNDDYNKITGFLWAYFQKNSGLTKSQANKYLSELVDEDDLKLIDLVENSGGICNILGDVAEGMSKAFKDMADSFKNKNN